MGSNRRFRQIRTASERGEGDTFEFTVGILPIVMLITLIAAVTIVRPAQIPVWIAARECARAGAATMDPEIGKVQAEEAGYNSIYNNPLVNLNGVQVVAVHEGTRGGNVTCTASYSVSVGSIPMAGSLFGNVPLQAVVVMKIEPLKSKWR